MNKETESIGAGKVIALPPDEIRSGHRIEEKLKHH